MTAETEVQVRPVAPRTGALLLALGVVTSIIGNSLHPSREDPMDNPRVFQEYAQSDGWITAHLGQFAGYLFAFAGLVVLSQLLLGERARAAVAAHLGFAAATASVAVAAVLQAVDGIALKALVDHWAQAAGPQQAVAFGAAESVRWLEIGINSLFRLLQGTTLVVVGLALVLSDRFPRWLGWLGIICGLALVLRGIAVAFVGFDLSNPAYLATSVVTSLPVTLLNVWMAAVAIFMWRRSPHVPGQPDGHSGPATAARIVLGRTPSAR
jgi:hypothetical protein